MRFIVSLACLVFSLSFKYLILFVVACTRTTASRHPVSPLTVVVFSVDDARDAASLPSFILRGIKAVMNVNVGSS